jgi:hypothetical protein
MDMTKRLVVSLAALLMMIPALSHSHAESQPLDTLSGSELGLQISDYRYEEHFNGSGFMSNVGTKLGITGSYIQTVSGGWYWGGDVRFATGPVNYTGSGTKAGNPEQLFDVRLTGGRDFARGSYLLSPYAGVGYRTLFNDLSGLTSTGAAGYRRYSTYVYLPLGLTHRFSVNDQARISTSLEYQHLLEGRQQSFLSDSNPLFNDPVNTQKNGYGARLVSSYETAHWSVGLFYQFWSLPDSDRSVLTASGVPVGAVIEPKNTTAEVGAHLKYRFY